MADKEKKELDKESEGQHELGSVRDGSADNEGMFPSNERGDEKLGQDKLTETDNEKSLQEARELAEKNSKEEETISRNVKSEENDFDPIAAGQEKAQKNHDREQDELDVTKDGTKDPVAEGKKQAKKNLADEKAKQAGKS